LKNKEFAVFGNNVESPTVMKMYEELLYEQASVLFKRRLKNIQGTRCSSSASNSQEIEKSVGEHDYERGN